MSTKQPTIFDQQMQVMDYVLYYTIMDVQSTTSAPTLFLKKRDAQIYQVQREYEIYYRNNAHLQKVYLNKFDSNSENIDDLLSFLMSKNDEELDSIIGDRSIRKAVVKSSHLPGNQTKPCKL